MPLAETVVLAVGPAIAKSILKLWLKEDVAVSAASSLVDVFTTRTKDVIAQQRAKRQFEAIGEQVAESLLPVFEREGEKLDEGEREAVAHALAETLNTGKISAELLAEKNLNPKRLVDHLNEAAPDAARDFSATGTALYGRVLSESCQCIVDIAAQLPHFTDRTFAEILKRESQLLDIAVKTLAEVQRIREVSEQANPEAKARRFEEDYRRAVVRTLDRIELFGADLSEASRRHRLSVAYVTLSVKRTGRSEQAAGNIVSVDEALAGASRLLVRGEAGSGKTTLLQWIAVRSALQDFEERLAGWNDTIPFFIRLREFSHKDLPRPETFPGLVAPAIADTMPDDWVHGHLDSGRAVVLIDGIDEIPEARRADVRQWIDGLVGSYPKARFLVTARPHAVEEGWMAREGFEDAELQRMELANVLGFIDHWHEAVREALQDAEKKAEMGVLAERLKRVVEERGPIRNLAANPLLCSMLCALHRDRHENIPRSRIALYEACCDLLINRRDMERKIHLEDYPPLTPEHRRLLLEDLAYWMLRNGFSLVALDEARAHLEPRVGRLLRLPQGADSEGVLRFLVERTGILREPVKGQMDFAHRTFQEYLAAKAALDEGDVGVLLQNADDDQWREVILLAVGLGKGMTEEPGPDAPGRLSFPFRRPAPPPTKKSTMGERIMKGLIERGDKDKEARHRLHLLAVACMETAVELSAEVQMEAIRRLTSLVPPKDFNEAVALASAGVLAVPHLVAKPQHEEPVAAACVRALAHIGGEEALTALEGYVGDAREAVHAELLRAWDSFDRSEYARRVLAQAFLHTSELRLERLSSLEGFEYLVNLTGLSLIYCPQVSELSPLSGLTNLRGLHLDHTPVSDLGPLSGLTNLRGLDLIDCPRVSDLGPLSGLTNLRGLDLIDCPRVSDLGPLSGLNNLTRLGLGGCREVSDLKPLAGLTNLIELNLTGCREVSDLKPLVELNNLTWLSLSGCQQVSDLEPLAGLTNLTWLSLFDCQQVSDLEPLAGLTNLTHLILSRTHVSDLSPLAGSTNLSVLELRSCVQVRDLGPLSGLTNLSELHLSYSLVRDLGPLSGLTNLSELDLSGLPSNVQRQWKRRDT